MKSKTSLFNWTVFRKDITRFFPVWVFYAVFQFMRMNNFPYEGDYLVASVAGSISGSVFTCLIYAPLVCLLLFGDLYKKRLCNGIHALPLQRHTLFLTHTAAALCFYIIPNGAVALIRLLRFGKYWYVSLYWLLGISLIYVCFLGICLFCTFCTGKRFAMVCLYIILLFFPTLCYGLYETLYEPMLPGIHVSANVFSRFSPLYALGSLDYIAVEDQSNSLFHLTITSLRIVGSDWLYLALWAGVGILFGAAALLLYRRRHLESAGNFMAVKIFRPFFLVFYTLLFTVSFWLSNRPGVILISLILGYFTGLMLLNRSLHVFSGKAWAGLGLFVGVIALSLVLTAVDVLGVTRWVPNPEDVKQVRLSTNDRIDIADIEPFYIDEEIITLRDEQSISDAIAIHKFAKSDHPATLGKEVAFNIEYTLKDGTVRKRYYTIPVSSPKGKLYRQYMSRPETLFGEDPEGFLSQALITSLNEHPLPLEEQETVKQLLLADCRAGYMAQNYSFHISRGYGLTLQHGENTMYLQVHDPQSSLYRWISENGYSWNPLK